MNFMFECPLYNDIRESISQPVFKNKSENSRKSDTEKLSHPTELKHRETLNLIEKTIFITYV